MYGGACAHRSDFWGSAGANGAGGDEGLQAGQGGADAHEATTDGVPSNHAAHLGVREHDLGEEKVEFELLGHVVSFG